MKNTIGEKLKFLIKEQNVTQAKLAKHIGLSPSRLSNYINDRREPDIKTLSKIAKYLKVDLNYFSDFTFHTKPTYLLKT